MRWVGGCFTSCIFAPVGLIRTGIYYEEAKYCQGPRLNKYLRVVRLCVSREGQITYSSKCDVVVRLNDILTLKVVEYLKIVIDFALINVKQHSSNPSVANLHVLGPIKFIRP